MVNFKFVWQIINPYKYTCCEKNHYLISATKQFSCCHRKMNWTQSIKKSLRQLLWKTICKLATIFHKNKFILQFYFFTSIFEVTLSIRCDSMIMIPSAWRNVHGLLLKPSCLNSFFIASVNNPTPFIPGEILQYSHFVCQDFTEKIYTLTCNIVILFWVMLVDGNR